MENNIQLLLQNKISNFRKPFQSIITNESIRTFALAIFENERNIHVKGIFVSENDGVSSGRGISRLSWQNLETIHQYLYPSYNTFIKYTLILFHY